MAISNFTIRATSNEIDEKVNRFIKRVYEHYLDTVNLDEFLNEIKEDILDKTEAYINAHRKRPIEESKTHLIDILRETSFIEKIDKATYRLSIGDERILDEKVPYWYVVNYGGIPWNGKGFYGLFEDGRPVQGGEGNKFIEGMSDEKGMGFMKPKNPIPPMHYLQYMAQLFNKAIRKFKIKRKKK